MVQPKNTEYDFAGFASEADVDYVLARRLTFLGGGPYLSRAGFFAQQACEKYLKAWSVQANSTYLETHKLTLLANYAKQLSPDFGYSEMDQDIRYFDTFDQVGRYGAMAKHDPLSQDNEHFSIRGVWTWDDASLRSLDRFVHNVRSKLDWAEIGWQDPFVPILKGYKRGHLLLDTWTDKQPLLVVLTRNNAFFKRA